MYKKGVGAGVWVVASAPESAFGRHLAERGLVENKQTNTNKQTHAKLLTRPQMKKATRSRHDRVAPADSSSTTVLPREREPPPTPPPWTEW